MNPHLPSRDRGSPAPSGWAGMPEADWHEVCLGLRHVREAAERQALLLALVHTRGSAPEQRAWQAATAELTVAARTRIWSLVDELPTLARLPVLEDALQRSLADPPAQRAAHVRAARQLMCADGRVGPLDRLVWLLLRQRLTGPRRAASIKQAAAQPAQDALADLPLSERRAIADVTAYLARLVPAPDMREKVGAAGLEWYRAVLRRYWFDDPPACQVPDGDRLAQALAQVQALSLAQRPVLLRLWVQTAGQAFRRLGQPWSAEAAQALRIAAHLLDVPLHPDLAGLFPALPARVVDGPPPLRH